MLFGGIILVLCAVMAVGIATRKEATIKVQRGGEGEVRRLAEGAVVNFYSAYLENRATAPADFAITAVQPSGFRVELLGPVRGIRLAANDNRRVDFLVKSTPVPSAPIEIDLQLLKDGKTIAVVPVTLSVK